MTTRTFLGYRRPDGRVGVRNHVLVLSATGLTSAAAAVNSTGALQWLHRPVLSLWRTRAR